jgi:hypothetical protein
MPGWFQGTNPTGCAPNTFGNFAPPPGLGNVPGFAYAQNPYFAGYGTMQGQGTQNNAGCEPFTAAA